MATKLEAQYHILPSDDNKRLFRKRHGAGEYTKEAVEALLEPELQPYSTDEGPEPIFSEKALIVMAICALPSDEASAKGILYWIENNFKNPRYRNRGIKRNILKILDLDDDFRLCIEDDDHFSPESRWRHQTGLRRLLRSMRDTNGHLFHPDQHIKHHANKLKTRAALDPALPVSKHPSGEQQLSASKSPTSVSNGGDRVVHLPYVSSRSPSPMLGGSANDMTSKSITGGDAAMRVLNQRPKPQCWEHGCNGRQFSTFSNLLRHQREKSVTASKSYCPRCGAEFTRTTARNGHLAHDNCTKPRSDETEDAKFSIETLAMSHPRILPEPEPLPGVAEIDPEPRPQSSTSFEGEEDAGHKASNEGSGHELTDDDAQTSMIDAALDYQIPVKGRLVNGRTFGLSLQQEHCKDSQRSTTGGEDGCSTQEQSGRSSHTAGLDDSKQASSDGPDDHEHLSSSILHETPLPGIPDSHNENAEVLPFHDFHLPSSQIDDIDTWSAHIESKSGSLNFARKHPEIAEYKDQDHRDQSVSSEFTSRKPWIDDLSNQPLEMEKKIDSQLEATEETKGLDSLEPGNGRKYIEDVQAASRQEAAMLDEIHESIDRGTFLIVFFFMVATISIVLELIPRLVGLGTPPLWMSALTILCQCLGIGLYAASDPVLTLVVLQGFGRKLKELYLGALTRLKRQYLDTPVPLGMKRIYWRCRCGTSIYDDFFERRPASIDSPADGGHHLSGPFSPDEQNVHRNQDSGKGLGPAFTEDAHETGTTSSPQQSGKSSSHRPAQRSVGYKLGNINTSSGNKSTTPSGSGSLPTGSLGTSVDNSTIVGKPPIPSHFEFLLLCIPFKSHANKLLNIDTTTPPSSDVAFFRLLRQTYTKNRGQFRNFFSIRALSEIRFVHFDAFRNDLVDMRKLDCIPPETQRDNYRFKPLPDKYEPPPIGKNRMRHLYDYPDHADEVLLDCFSRVPRKLRERLSVAPGMGRSEGWGICFMEGVSWPRVCALGLAGVLASTIFGILWTVVQDDIQGGFGVASYMLGVLVLGLGALQGAFEM